MALAHIMHGAQQYPKQPRNFVSRVLKNMFNRNEERLKCCYTIHILFQLTISHITTATKLAVLPLILDDFSHFLANFSTRLVKNTQEIIQRLTNDALFLD